MNELEKEEQEEGLVFESSKYLSDKYCGCEEQTLRPTILFGELHNSDVRVYLQKSKSTARYVFVIRGKKPIQNNANIHFLFPNECLRRLNALDNICLINLHNHLSGLFKTAPCVKERILEKVITFKDDFCSCNVGEKLQIHSKDLKISLRQDAAIAFDDFKKPLSESGTLFQIESVPNLEHFAFGSLRHPIVLKKGVNLWMRALRQLEISDINLTGTNGFMELPQSLEMNLSGVIIRKEEADFLKHQKRNRDILYWQYGWKVHCFLLFLVVD